MLRWNRIFAMAALCLLAALLSGCGGPTAEELAARGIEVTEYSADDLAMRVEQAAIGGQTAFVVNYLGDQKGVENPENELWRKGYICRRFVDTLTVEYEDLDGFVRASYRFTMRDAGVLYDMLRGSEGVEVHELSDEAIEDCIEDMLLDGAERRVFLFEPAESISEFDGRVYDGVVAAQAVNYACEYMTDQVSWTVTNYEDVTELELSLAYTSGRMPLSEITVVRDRRELVELLSGLWNQRVSAEATLLLEGLSLSGEELLALLDVAESNCAWAPCEADKLWYEQYTEQDGKQIVRVWLEVPLSWDSLSSKAEELEAEVIRRGDLIAGKHTEPEKQLRAVYREVISAAKYDDEMSEATANETLTDEMRWGRSAYGALVEGYTVCSGYARAYKALCDYLGLECYVISGSRQGENHAWNMVVLDGEALYVDCSFADTGGGSRYCLFGEEMYQEEGYIPADSFRLMGDVLLQ